MTRARVRGGQNANPHRTPAQSLQLCNFSAYSRRAQRGLRPREPRAELPRPVRALPRLRGDRSPQTRSARPLPARRTRGERFTEPPSERLATYVHRLAPTGKPRGTVARIHRGPRDAANDALVVQPPGAPRHEGTAEQLCSPGVVHPVCTRRRANRHRLPLPAPRSPALRPLAALRPLVRAQARNARPGAPCPEAGPRDGLPPHPAHFEHPGTRCPAPQLEHAPTRTHPGKKYPREGTHDPGTQCRHPGTICRSTPAPSAARTTQGTK